CGQILCLPPTAYCLLIRMFLDVIDRLSDGLDFLGLFVGDGELEFVLELHDELDGVEGIGVEVVDEVGLAGDLALVDAHLLADDLDDLLFSFVHNGSWSVSGAWVLWCFPCPSRAPRPVRFGDYSGGSLTCNG